MGSDNIIAGGETSKRWRLTRSTRQDESGGNQQVKHIV